MISAVLSQRAKGEGFPRRAGVAEETLTPEICRGQPGHHHLRNSSEGAVFRAQHNWAPWPHGVWEVGVSTTPAC